MLNYDAVYRLIPRDHDFDVIVCGGGPSGLAAAVCSAHAGARTLLLEAEPVLWHTGTVCDRASESAGFYSLFMRRTAELALRGFELKSTVEAYGLMIPPEYLNLAGYASLEAASCNYRMRSPVTDVIVRHDRVTGVTVSTKSGERALYARAVVDATATGEVAKIAGCEVLGADEPESQGLPFALIHVNTDVFLRYVRMSPDIWTGVLKKAAEEGYVTSGSYRFTKSPANGVLHVENDGPLEIFKSECKTRTQYITQEERLNLKMALDFVRFVHEAKVPGMEQAQLMRTGDVLSVRTQYRIHGEAVYTWQDALNGTQFRDTAFYRALKIAKNGPVVSDRAFPFRCMVPFKIDGLLLSGRHASQDLQSARSGETVENAMAFGQIAGVAAAMAGMHNLVPRDLSAETVRSMLKKIIAAMAG